MKPPEDWFDQFFTDEQQRKMARFDERQSLEQKRGMGEALQAFFSEVKLHLHRDVQDNDVQMLVERGIGHILLEVHSCITVVL